MTGDQSRDVIALPDFIANFGVRLLDAVRQQNPSIFIMTFFAKLSYQRTRLFGHSNDRA